MFTPSINLIAAIGKNGQLGLNGELPWKDSEDPAVQARAAADMRFFKRSTHGCVIVVGHNTYVELCQGKHPVHYWNKTDRVLVEFPRVHYDSPESFFRILLNMGKDIWIAGGAATYRRLFPFVNGVVSINVIKEYDGIADTYFPFDAVGKHAPAYVFNAA